METLSPGALDALAEMCGMSGVCTGFSFAILSWRFDCASLSWRRRVNSMRVAGLRSRRLNGAVDGAPETPEYGAGEQQPGTRKR